jgi:hypothetical protein
MGGGYPAFDCRIVVGMRQSQGEMSSLSSVSDWIL